MEYEKPEHITEAMKSGLARLYADVDIRAYLTNAINIANQNVLLCVKAGKQDEARDFVARLTALELLIEKGKTFYHDFEKINKVKE